MDSAVEQSIPERSLAIRRACARLCLHLGWSALHEMPLPNGRRADIMALRPDGGFACIEVKSGPRDFLTDGKWPEYRAFSDCLYFAVDQDFPLALLPDDTGLIVACGNEAEVLREAPSHPLPPARRRAQLHRFATLAAQRLAWLQDPEAQVSVRMALRAE
ncbi:MAG: MmcB family DNA repair protein [Gemmatimonadaceae bacterium]|nr:MmcB family DNA repair protein [Acetobacteraceae bacterium]